jgi:multidrug efflux system membrane fusion protein
MKLNRSYAIIIILVGVVIIWFAYGFLFSSNNKKEEATVPKETPITKVQTQGSQATIQTVFLRLSGRTEASKVVVLNPEIDGSVEKILVLQGSYVKKGTPLVKLTLEDRAQKVEAAESAFAMRQKQHEAATRLFEKQYSSPISVSSTKAQLAEAKLNLSRAKLGLQRIFIKAPFDGIVNDYQMDPGSSVSAMSATRIGTFVSLNPLTITVQVTENVFHQLQKGKRAEINLADGRTAQGIISYISSVADPQTNTFKVRISIENAENLIPAGMTAAVILPLMEQKVHKLDSSFLTLSDQGEVGVKIVEGGKATFVPTVILESSSNHILVSGLPDVVELIVLGQESVLPGEKVVFTPRPLEDPPK